LVNCTSFPVMCNVFCREPAEFFLALLPNVLLVLYYKWHEKIFHILHSLNLHA
jgi:hypothetical protein